MKKVIVWLITSAVGLLALLVLSMVGVYLISETRLNQEYQVKDLDIAIPEDSLSQARGNYLVSSLVGCRDCHGYDLGGKAFITDPAIGMVYGPNLTVGVGGVGGAYTDQDWVRAIRHGIGPDNKALLAIPANEYMHFSEADLAALIAYLKNLPPVDRTMPESKIGPLGRVLLVLGQFPPPAAEAIDHNTPVPAPVSPDSNATYGEYLVSLGCIGCHQADLSGGPIPGAPPDWPSAPALDADSVAASWSEAEFVLAMRSGMTPDGKAMNPAYMPWPIFTNLSDSDLTALWNYLQSLSK